MLLERNADIETAQLDTTTVLYDATQDSYLLLDTPAALAWSALQSPVTEDGLTRQVAERLPLPPAEARAAAADAVQDLRSLGVIAGVSASATRRPRYARVLSAAAFAATFTALVATLGSGAALAQSYGGGDPV